MGDIFFGLIGASPVWVFVVMGIIWYVTFKALDFVLSAMGLGEIAIAIIAGLAALALALTAGFYLGYISLWTHGSGEFH